MTSNPFERKTDRPLEDNVPEEEGISDAKVAEQLEQDPEEVPNRTEADEDEGKHEGEDE